MEFILDDDKERLQYVHDAKWRLTTSQSNDF